MTMGEAKFKKAVVAIDESDEGAHALQWALEFMLRPGDAVVILYSTASPGLDLSHRECKIMTNYKRACQSQGLEVACLVSEGDDPRGSIALAVARTKADVLITSSDSYGGFKGISFNGMEFKCPVLVVKKP